MSLYGLYGDISDSAKAASTPAVVPTAGPSTEAAAPILVEIPKPGNLPLPASSFLAHTNGGTGTLSQHGLQHYTSPRQNRARIKHNPFGRALSPFPPSAPSQNHLSLYLTPPTHSQLLPSYSHSARQFQQPLRRQIDLLSSLRGTEKMSTDSDRRKRGPKQLSRRARRGIMGIIIVGDLGNGGKDGRILRWALGRIYCTIQRGLAIMYDFFDIESPFLFCVVADIPSLRCASLDDQSVYTAFLQAERTKRQEARAEEIRKARESSEYSEDDYESEEDTSADRTSLSSICRVYEAADWHLVCSLDQESSTVRSTSFLRHSLVQQYQHGWHPHRRLRCQSLFGATSRNGRRSISTTIGPLSGPRHPAPAASHTDWTRRADHRTASLPVDERRIEIDNFRWTASLSSFVHSRFRFDSFSRPSGVPYILLRLDSRSSTASSSGFVHPTFRFEFLRRTISRRLDFQSDSSTASAWIPTSAIDVLRRTIIYFDAELAGSDVSTDGRCWNGCWTECWDRNGRWSGTGGSCGESEGNSSEIGEISCDAGRRRTGCSAVYHHSIRRVSHFPSSLVSRLSSSSKRIVADFNL